MNFSPTLNLPKCVLFRVLAVKILLAGSKLMKSGRLSSSPYWFMPTASSTSCKGKSVCVLLKYPTENGSGPYPSMYLNLVPAKHWISTIERVKLNDAEEEIYG